MKKILIITDNPSYHTGQGYAGLNLATHLSKNNQVTYLAWGNSQKKEKFNFKVIEIPNPNELVNYFDKIIHEEYPDMVITISDPWIVKCIATSQSRNMFRWIGYLAVDGLNYKNKLPNFWKDIVSNMDNIITWSYYGKNALIDTFPELKNIVEVIPLGYEDGLFEEKNKVEKLKLRKQYGIPEDKFIFLFVGRNQPRKNISELFKIWSEFYKLDKECLLWPHFNFRDEAGFNVPELISNTDIEIKSLIFFKEVAYANTSVDLLTRHQLIDLYHMCDCYINLSSEGYGLTIIEAMAAGLPCILLDHSASGEHAEFNRAIKIDVAYNGQGVYFTERPVPDIKKTAKTMKETKDLIISNNEKIKNIKINANIYSQNKTWICCFHKWDILLKKIYKPFQDKILLEEL